MVKVQVPSKAPTATAPASARPGTKDDKGAKEKKQRVKYPGLTKDGKAVKLAAIPDDYDPKVHKPLGRKDLEDESLWYELKARDFERKAKLMREKGEESKKLGSVADRAKAKRLLALQKRFNELKQKLTSQGMDVESLLNAPAEE